MGEEAAAATVTAAAAAAASGGAPHLLLICFPGQGHVNPMLRLAKRIAAKGLVVTFSSTSAIGAKLVESSGVSVGGDGVPLGGGRIRFEFLEDGFDGSDLDELMRHLGTAGPAAFAELLARQEAAGRPVACVVGNPFIPWAVDVAAAAGILSAVLWVQSLTEAIQQQIRTIDKATWVFVNSFTELERDVVDALRGVATSPPQPKLIPVGPLIELEGDAAVRGDMIRAADDCVGWLDEHPPRSVVYASLGSVVVLSAGEVAEMAHGLASTGRPFLWVHLIVK
ncbi:hypothetical protein OsJ_05681 [Oryza sativa Japonica Group]|uniref:Uncharacterized protein n=1 Tax=Oryza sativa subsp. japonica TaxID=39947 RepID=B9F3R5_ORYSJ|nr:hypothetical protein OsJ_05681 [Oryza sativa Japonica Group]